MKKKIHKIWGVGLVVVLATSLLLATAPVSAGTLSWSTESIPSTTGNVLSANSSVADIAVADDGTIYLVTGTDNRSYKSTNGGVTWSKLTKQFLFDPEFVAVAPDNSDMVAVGDAATGNVTVSSNGGSTWGVLGQAGAACDTMQDLAISNTDGSVNYLAVAGDDGSNADIWYFKLGATAPAWKSTKDQDGFDATSDKGLAVAFSPNIASDKQMIAVTGLYATNTTFQMYSMSTDKWNTITDYPVAIENGTTPIPSTDTACIALAPDYLGSDDSMRIAFVGLNTSTVYAGVYRLKDVSIKDIYDGTGYDIHSIDYDGTNLVAGNSDNRRVYRCDDPLASSPTFSTASDLKRPGTSGCTKTVVVWKGSDVVAGTTGTGSAFSISHDDGKSFNDISMVEIFGTNLGTLDDVAVAADGEAFYMLTRDAKALSLWRKASSWERVFSIATDTDYLVRSAPDDSDAVYLAKTGSAIVYFSQEGGDTKWFTRTSKYSIQDMAVESSDTAYIAVDGSPTVSKTTNSGFTWGTEEQTGIGGDYVYMIRSLGEDKVIVGSNDGHVAWSSDGADSWSKVNRGLYAAGNTQVTASGLSDGDFIYAATDGSGTYVERWEIGQSGSTWKDLAATFTSAYVAKGIGLREGVLYVQSANSSGTGSELLRTLSPDSGEPSTGMWSTKTSTADFEATPQALKVSSGSTKLWSVDTTAADLYSYTDTLTEAGPTLLGPRDGLSVEINPVSGVSYDVAFTWERPSKATIYDIKIALDSGFTEILSASTTTSSTTDAQISEVVAGSNFMPETTYYWRVRVNIAGPVKSPYSETRSFTIGELPEALAPVIIEQPPAPVIQVPPAPAITIEPPEIVLPPYPAPVPPPEIVIPPAPAPAPAVPGWALWAIIIIGAVLVIALIVLIMRTRRPI